ncbi:MAG TPA: hypothetical protein VMJ10_21005 [Kofleriaceae bacterium]|nr:hypothetical protein [Kofleriaceae bacterium]
MQAARIAVGIALVALNFAYWWRVARHWEGRFRRWVERRYRVEIRRVNRGYWEVHGDGPWLRRFAIEWLQLVFFVAAFVGWAALMVAGFLLIEVM